MQSLLAKVKPRKSLPKSRPKVCNARKADKSPTHDRATASLLNDQRAKVLRRPKVAKSTCEVKG
jgi:hypothetical protein